MNNTDKNSVIKHLEMTQAVINRLGSNSFLLKGWSMTIVALSMVLTARYGLQHPYIILAFFLPVLGFWLLDGYFLWQERLFRKVYDEVRQKNDTDFMMDPMKHDGKPKCTWLCSVFSVTLVIFYGMECVFIILVYFITKFSYQEVCFLNSIY